MLDEDCWHCYPNQRILYNKLWLADTMGYLCGPCGVRIPEDDYYIVRPIYNLDGMSRGAVTKYLKAGDESTPLGYFWCEYFEGIHYSVDFEYCQENFKQILVVKGEKESEYKFTSWTRLPTNKITFEVPDVIKFICGEDVQYLNIEYIDNKIIEIHLRRNPDFLHNRYTKLDVAWLSSFNKEHHEMNASNFISAAETVYNHHHEAIDYRLGFYGKGIILE